MIPSSLRKKIFIAVPLAFECECGTFQVHKEYAPYAKVTEYLRQNPNHIYIALDFSDDVIDRDETPCNYMMDYNMSKTKLDTPFEPIEEYEMTYGTRNKCRLAMHVYATWQPNYNNVIQAIDEILGKLQFWAVLDLEQIVDYPTVNSIQAIDETTDRIIHRIIDIDFEYTVLEKRRIRTINSIEYNTEVDPIPKVSIEHTIIAEPTDKYPIPEENPRGHIVIRPWDTSKNQG